MDGDRPVPPAPPLALPSIAGLEAKSPTVDGAPASPRPPFKMVYFGGQTLTPGEQVDLLTRTGSAEDAFRASGILSICADSRSPGDENADPNSVPDGPGVCRGITPAHMSMRYPLLQRAVQANIETAAALAQRIAPDGRSAAAVGDDPAYAEWKRTSQLRLEEAANAGDAMALMQMAMQTGDRSSTAFDAGKAITYWTALADKLASTDPRYVDKPDMLLTLQAESRDRVGQYSQGMSEDAVRAAVSAGHGLAALRH
ncbi:MAG: hypothetical protein M3Z16_00585 [Pseudomonadota bacterium]|nr:hypothetical protein [Pseudomonadota bacterium]